MPPMAITGSPNARGVANQTETLRRAGRGGRTCRRRCPPAGSPRRRARPPPPPPRMCTERPIQPWGKEAPRLGRLQGQPPPSWTPCAPMAAATSGRPLTKTAASGGRASASSRCATRASAAPPALAVARVERHRRPGRGDRGGADAGKSSSAITRRVGDGVQPGQAASLESAPGRDASAAHPVLHAEAIPPGGLDLAHRDRATAAGDHQPVRSRRARFPARRARPPAAAPNSFTGAPSSVVQAPGTGSKARIWRSSRADVPAPVEARRLPRRSWAHRSLGSRPAAGA